jgi:hypothetical protein
MQVTLKNGQPRYTMVMGETIRDYIKRRVQWGFGIGFVSWLFIALTSNMGFGGPRPGYFPFIGVFGFIGAILSFLFIRCPKCRARLYRDTKR